MRLPSDNFSSSSVGLEISNVPETAVILHGRIFETIKDTRYIRSGGYEHASRELIHQDIPDTDRGK